MAQPRVVIIGCGFGGLHAAKRFKHAAVQVTVVDRTNYHLFQPLLYQVATATLAPTDITVPIRWALRKQPNTEVVMAEATAVDAVSPVSRNPRRTPLARSRRPLTGRPRTGAHHGRK
jgi:NADH:ubiquinone reductase (H+-translocating)